MNIFNNIIKHYCSNNQDISGEYISRFKIDFILTEPIEFYILETKYIIDRVRMENGDCDIAELYNNQNSIKD